ncbi:MAG: ABC transporter permease subunit [Acidobacteriota bacterium]
MTRLSFRRTVALCARQELMLALRSRWTQIFAVVFAALALGVAFSGYILSGGRGVQDFARTAASLVQLVLLLVPLTALLLGVLSLTPGPGAAELLYSQPVARPAVLVGRTAGLLLALVAAEFIGFGASGLVIYANAGPEGLTGFFAVVAASVVLTAVCLGLAALISSDAGSHRRARALAFALVAWVVLVLAFDLAALGLASMLRSGTASRLLIVASLANPIDAIQTGALLAIEGTAAFGPASLALIRFSGSGARTGVLIGLSLAVWLVVPLVVASWRLARADI